uniref:Translation initiation factor IF-2, chloroplastic n=1 Tax=Corynoplastis japonica TaxID=700918 RepID=A0A1X9PTR7_9RHOD|nr:initiation factor IF2 [Corynoplastis japonica]
MNNNRNNFVYHNNRQSDSILELTKPYIITKIETKSISKIDQAVSEISKPGSPKNYINNTPKLEDKPVYKIDKKIKNKSDVLSEGKKIKNKSKKKSQSKFDLHDEDDENYNTFQKDDINSTSHLALSLMRPPRVNNNLLNSTQNSLKSKKTTNKVQKIKIDTKETSSVATEYQFGVLRDSLTVQELSNILQVAEAEIIKFLFLKGICATINQVVDIETSKLVAQNFNINVTIESKNQPGPQIKIDKTNEIKLEKRPPVVTIMGHIDHGKTTLLDKIRNTNTADKEAGGITQLMSSYSVEFKYKEQIHQVSFIDTPGHEAFIGMRSRGINVTDIVILVVDATDGIQTQTVELIDLIKRAQIPIIVAINKIDKQNANIDRTKEQLSKYGLIAEDWGGNIPMVPISALSGQNLDQLLEMIILISELENFQANPHRNAQGTVLEAYLNRTKGPVATLLIQNGSLKVGDVLVAGNILAKVRVILNDKGQKIQKATPSSPVEIWGFSKVPNSGNLFEVYNTEQEAKAVVNEYNKNNDIYKQPAFISSSTVNLFNKMNNAKQINLIIKTDVQGSAEALLKALQEIPQTKVQIMVLLITPGEITETDVELASTTKSKLIGFNTLITTGAKTLANQEDIVIKQYKIIYELLEELKSEMINMLDPIYIEEEIGEAIVRTIFPLTKGVVAGCFVQKGRLNKNCLIEVIRDKESVYKGEINSLRKVKESVIEINAESECGLFVESFDKWRENDTIIAYELVQQINTLE